MRLGDLLLLVWFIGLVGWAWMLLSSEAVLINEERLEGGFYECTYFTGTRVVTRRPGLVGMGCKRLIDVEDWNEGTGGAGHCGLEACDRYLAGG